MWPGECWPHDPVAVLCRAVESCCGTPPEHQVLLYNGKVLQPPGARLCSFSLRHGCFVVTSGRLIGAGGGLDDPEGDLDAAIEDEHLFVASVGACGSDGPFAVPEDEAIAEDAVALEAAVMTDMTED